MLKNFTQSLKTHKKAIIIALVFLFVGLFGRLLVEGAKWSPVIFQYFFHKEIDLKKTEDRVNVLFLGIGGGKHDGPLLTDTLIYVSIDPEFQKVTLISIPRDLWITDLKSKINTAYSSGEARKKDGGLLLTKAVVEKIFNQPVDYVLRIDFNGFIKAIDMVGGIDVSVQKGFEDLEYPIAGKETDPCGFTGEEFEKRATSSAIFEVFPCRYEHLVFKDGVQHMDGEKALKFVRSRHAKGTEGTDFARSRRQEIVIEAFKDKVFSLNTLLNPGKLMNLYNVFQDSIHTNIQAQEYDDFAKLAMKVKDVQVNSVVFFYSDPYSEKQGIFINPPESPVYNNQWVLIPRRGREDFSEVQRHVECEIKIGDCPLQ
ncbi:MAG: LCP family protein [Candidatus Levybacteria bacterium]|nr:LCP family protein [Candidatus Levybacteria bacterium]